MSNVIELRYLGRDPQNGRFRRETEKIPLTDGCATGSSTEDGKMQTFLFPNPDVVINIKEPNEYEEKIEGVLFRFQKNESEEVFFIPKGLDLDNGNLSDIFGGKIMSSHRFVSLNTE